MSWYRTYRPHTIGGLHLPLVRASLDRVRTSGAFSHAYLFTGPKGTGKTSSARIIAMMLNCEKNRAAVEQFLKTGKAVKNGFVEPCGTCANCKKIADGTSFNVTEMDAASNRGIDDIRVLRERLNLAPTDGPVAVYIIDEVHMLTTEAFNALLKVLEEPPRHVVFVLATTELHKVPDTVVSRCTMVSYTKARVEDLQAALEGVLKSEKISFEPEVVIAIAEQADGSFRDAIKMLEHVAVGKSKISLKDFTGDQRGAASEALSLLQAIETRDVQKVADLFRGLTERDVDVLFIQKEVLRLAHESLVRAIAKNEASTAKQYAKLLSALNTPLDPLLPIAHLPFELACMSWCFGEESEQENGGPQGSGQEQNKQEYAKQQRDGQKNEAKQEHPPAKTASAEDDELKSSKSTTEAVKKDPMPVVPDVEEVSPTQTLVLEQVLTRWQDILKEVRPANASVEAFLRAARPSKADNKAVTIEVFYPFHKEQLEQDKHRRVLESVITHMFSLPRIKLVFVLGEKKKPIAAAETSVQSTASPADKKTDEEMERAATEAFLS